MVLVSAMEWRSWWDTGSVLIRGWRAENPSATGVGDEQPLSVPAVVVVMEEDLVLGWKHFTKHAIVESCVCRVV